jgi:hypothetical protein
VSRGIELVLTHPDLDDLTEVTTDEVRMTEDAHARLVDAIVALGYDVDEVTVVDLEDEEPVAVELGGSTSPYGSV